AKNSPSSTLDGEASLRGTASCAADDSPASLFKRLVTCLRELAQTEPTSQSLLSGPGSLPYALCQSPFWAAGATIDQATFQIPNHGAAPYLTCFYTGISERRLDVSVPAPEVAANPCPQLDDPPNGVYCSFQGGRATVTSDDFLHVFTSRGDVTIAAKAVGAL